MIIECDVDNNIPKVKFTNCVAGINLTSLAFLVCCLRNGVFYQQTLQKLQSQLPPEQMEKLQHLIQLIELRSRQQKFELGKKSAMEFINEN